MTGTPRITRSTQRGSSRVLSAADFNALPRTFLGANMPSHASLISQDRERRCQAQLGSEALLTAIQRYFARGGRA
jgi:hypothetical protein